MKISRNWLEKYFDKELPGAEEIGKAFTFHSFEIEEIEVRGDDHILDIKVLPDRTHDCLSYRGIAKDLGVILNTPIAHDPLKEVPNLSPDSKYFSVSIETPLCARFSSVVIKNVKVGPSPKWLQSRIESTGGRSINNVVDATNFVMFNIGQPLHAFDADKLEGVKKKIIVRGSKEGEKTVALDGNEYALSPETILITDGNTAGERILGIAGIKGGKHAEIGDATTNLIIEAANFNPTAVRKSSKALNLRTDASQRFENEISPELTIYALNSVVELVLKIAGGEVDGFTDVYPNPQKKWQVSFTGEETNRLLGTSISDTEIEQILKRFEFTFEKQGNAFIVTPPFERLDLVIKEDLIAEIGRIYGCEKIPTTTPSKENPQEINKLFYYTQKVRKCLMSLGFSEIYTSSFAHKGDIELVKSLASDKQFLRGNLSENMEEALKLNSYNADLLGLSAVKTFEIGNVFKKDNEATHLVLGIGKIKKGEEILEEAIKNLSDLFSLSVKDLVVKEKKDPPIIEFDFTNIVSLLENPKGYEPFEGLPDVKYKTFSIYPFVSRDVSLFVEEGVTKENVEKVIGENGGELLIRITCFDEFKKDGKVSYAFRLIFQSYEKTLSDEEVNELMEKVVSALQSKQWQVR